MVGKPYDCLANPLGAVRYSFENAVAFGADPSSLNGKDWGAVDLFRNTLLDQGSLSKVPVLSARNVGLLQPNMLVRFRGMIQDMLGNEFYAGAFKDGSLWRTNKYVDVSQYLMGSSPDMLIWERHLFYCVPIPGLNSWAEESTDVAISQPMGSTPEPREKRPRDENEAMREMDESLETSPGSKRMRNDSHPSHSQMEEAAALSTCGAGALPKTEADSFSCLVKIYDNSDSELRLNDVFEFVGVLTFGSECQADNDETMDGFSGELSVHMPPGKVPRLHCIIHRKLAVHDFVHGLPMEPKPQLIKEVRQSLLAHLTAILGNDTVAAHFVLLHLLSKVHARIEDFAVGKLSLNLTCFNKERASTFGNFLCSTVKELLPFTHKMLVTIDYLNKASFAPKKDYERNRLMTGVLQLPESSHVVIDETQLEAGTLNSDGVQNARLLTSLTEFQKLEYDFKYYKMDVVADVQLLILSEGKSNIMPADLVVPFRPSSEAAGGAVLAEALKAWRWYLVTVRSLPHSIDPDLQKVVENDLVYARQSKRSLTSQDFSRWLTMGRLVSLSLGETSLSLEHWQTVKELERLRGERLG
ncbi:hypothetical protein MLD38_011077 [Melastoma candidum]|uniref:Uncharacterized protein n=1 Tax=Melastoma candidum TaxID=119954 RepID=A0ACB9R3N9_9MYRT|nr:hypothetical protein MLD38_011077 [Melastoma candidum]